MVVEGCGRASTGLKIAVSLVGDPAMLAMPADRVQFWVQRQRHAPGLGGMSAA